MDASRRHLLLGLAALTVAPATQAQDAAWQALAAGGVALLLRHALTDPGVGDPPGFRLDDCSTQRNLSPQGREQASRIGRTLRTRGITFDEVLTSRWCRCLDTARLVAPEPPVSVFEPLNSAFNDRSVSPAQAEALRRYLQGLRAPRRALLVSHGVNIGALTGQAVAMGEGLVVRADGSNIAVVGRLNAGA
jgi:broad specificity phosphatase PhoE